MQITSFDARVEFMRGRQEPVEELETVNLNYDGTGKTLRIGLKIEGS